jgi:AraC family transcriptional regulator
MIHSQAITRSSDANGTLLQMPGFRVAFGRHAADSVLPRHTHDSPTICCVERGRFIEYYRGKAVDCDERMVKVTPAGDPHWNRFEGTETRGIRIDIDRGRFEGLGAVHQLLDERRFFRASVLHGWTRRLVDELTAPDDAAPVAVEGLLLEMLARLSRLRSPRMKARPEWLLAADELVREGFRSPLTLSSVAAQVGVHPTTLARAYRRAYGCTVGERIRELRIEYAAAELATSSASLSEVGLRAGFYDQSHFTNIFRRYRQLTPAEYRRSYQRSNSMGPTFSGTAENVPLT